MKHSIFMHVFSLVLQMFLHNRMCVFNPIAPPKTKLFCLLYIHFLNAALLRWEMIQSFSVAIRITAVFPYWENCYYYWRFQWSRQVPVQPRPPKSQYNHTHPNLMKLEPASSAHIAHLAILKLLFLSSVAKTAPPCESNFFLQSIPPECYNIIHTYIQTPKISDRVKSNWLVDQNVKR